MKKRLNPWDTKRKRNRLTKVCEVCGKEFFLPAYYKDDKNRGKYCCRECYYKDRFQNKPIFKCIVCGKEFKTGMGYKQSKRFCSIECNAEYFKKTWNMAREACLFRDNYTCQKCGVKEGQVKRGVKTKLEVHHLDETGNNRPVEEMNNDLNNLIALCHHCHMEEEKKLKGGAFSKGKTKKDVARDEKIYELYRYKSMSQSKIARLFGLTRQRVHQIIGKML